LEVRSAYRLEGDGYSVAVDGREIAISELARDRNLVASNGRRVCLYMLMSLLSLIFIFPAVVSGDSVSQYKYSWTPEWYQCGGSSWYQCYDKNIGDVLRSGPIECTGVSRICADVTGPANISFLWKTDATYQMIGQLSFQVDDTRHVCDTTNWTPITYIIWDNKTHKLMWEFRKIKCYPKNVGAGWIGEVLIDYRDDRVKSMSGIEDSRTGYAEISNEIKKPIENETTILSSEKNDKVVIVNVSLNKSNPDLHEWRDIASGIKDAYDNDIYNVLIKNGNYSLDRTILLNKSISIEGETEGNIYIKSNIKSKDNNNIAIKIVSKDCIIRNLTLEEFTFPIYSEQGDGLVIERNIFDNLNAINESTAITLAIVSEFNILENVFNDFNNSIFLKSSKNGNVDGNYFLGRKGIHLIQCNNISVTKNNFTEISVIGFSINRSSNIMLHNNNMRSCDSYWMRIDDHKSTNIDCNWWNDLNCNCTFIGLCDNKSCDILCADNSYIKDEFTYCIDSGWI
jgi:parallel beta-helix repeat protein